MKKIFFPLVMGLISTSFCGCEVSKAVAPRTNVVASDLLKFPKQDIEFYSNQLFLWQESVTPEQVSRVLFLSDEIDRLEHLITPQKNRIKVLDQTLQPVEATVRTKKIELSSKTNKLKKKNEDLVKKNAKIIEIQVADQEEKAKANPDPQALQSFSQSLQTLENEKTILEAEIQTLGTQKSQIEQDISQLNQNSLIVERTQLQNSREANEGAKTQNIAEVTQIVHWYDPQPAFIGFHFEKNGDITVRIRGWGLSRDEVKEWDFSTLPGPGGKPSIENVKYQEAGGIFEFDVKVYEDENQVNLRESYSFRIARNKYNTTDGKIYYSGTLKRYRFNSDGTTEVREGIVKLVDKNY